jgi:hypothetical protein
MLELCQTLLKPNMYVHGSRDGPDGTRTGTMSLNRLYRGLFQARMITQAQVVVGTEHQNVLSINRAPWSTRTLQNSQFPVKLTLHQILVLFTQERRGIPHFHHLFFPSIANTLLTLSRPQTGFTACLP